MKTQVKIINLFVIFALLFSVCFNTFLRAEENCISWYIKKKGHNTPEFPEECDVIDAFDGYYIDKVAAASGEKVIYLTFDAGYENGNVEKIIDILNDNGIKGAFFILNQIILKSPETVKKMFVSGHTVCNHTKNHKNMAHLTKEEMKANLETLEEICFNSTGYSMTKFFRFPEGKFSKRTLTQASEFGYKTFFWSLAYADWDNHERTDDAKAINKLISNTHPGCILLLHPTSDVNVRILPILISKWREMGYTFGTLEELVEKNA